MNRSWRKTVARVLSVTALSVLLATFLADCSKKKEEAPKGTPAPVPAPAPQPGPGGTKVPVTPPGVNLTKPVEPGTVIGLLEFEGSLREKTHELSQVDLSNNCMRLVKTQKGNLVAELGNQACPADKTAQLASGAVILRLDVQPSQVRSKNAQLLFEGKAVGWISADVSLDQYDPTRGHFQAVVIRDLCSANSKDNAYCRIEVRNGHFAGITRVVRNVWLAHEVQKGLGLQNDYINNNCVQLVEQKLLKNIDGKTMQETTNQWIEFVPSVSRGCPASAIAGRINYPSVLNLTYAQIKREGRERMDLWLDASGSATGYLRFRNQNMGDYEIRDVTALGGEDVPSDSLYRWSPSDKVKNSAFIITRLGNADNMGMSIAEKIFSYSHYRVDTEQKEASAPILFKGITRTIRADVTLSPDFRSKVSDQTLLRDLMAGDFQGEPSSLSTLPKEASKDDNCYFWEERFTGNAATDLSSSQPGEQLVTFYASGCISDYRGFVVSTKDAQSVALGKSSINLHLAGEGVSSGGVFLLAPDEATQKLINVGYLTCKALAKSEDAAIRNFHLNDEIRPFRPQVGQVCYIDGLCSRVTTANRDFGNNCHLEPLKDAHFTKLRVQENKPNFGRTPHDAKKTEKKK